MKTLQESIMDDEEEVERSFDFVEVWRKAEKEFKKLSFNKSCLYDISAYKQLKDIFDLAIKAHPLLSNTYLIVDPAALIYRVKDKSSGKVISSIQFTRKFDRNLSQFGNGLLRVCFYRESKEFKEIFDVMRKIFLKELSYKDIPTFRTKGMWCVEKDVDDM